jgi:DNA-binding Lrp family transcriptional regulator
MDHIDKRIIEILKADASVPLSKVADMIGIPRPTAYLRFNKLKEKGIIKGFNLVLSDERSKGPLKTALLTVRDYLLSDMSERTVKALGDKLSRRSEVIMAARVSKNTILVIWSGDSFRPSEYRDVVAVEEIHGEVYKLP